MVLNTGKVGFTMEFDTGDKATIYINPNDKNIRQRISEFQSKVEQQVEQIDFDKYNERLQKSGNIGITSVEQLFDMDYSELVKINEQVQIIEDIEKEHNDIFKKEFDEVFKSPVSEQIFKYCEPLDVVVLEDGTRELYIMHFFKWFGLEMEKYAKANQGVMDKHLAKYVKK